MKNYCLFLLLILAGWMVLFSNKCNSSSKSVVYSENYQPTECLDKYNSCKTNSNNLVNASPPSNITPFSPEQRGPYAGSPDRPMTETANLCNPHVLIPITQPNVYYGNCPNTCGLDLYITSP